MKKIHGNIDILDLFEAISQYNTVTDNDKYCVAFLMSCWFVSKMRQKVKVLT